MAGKSIGGRRGGKGKRTLRNKKKIGLVKTANKRKVGAKGTGLFRLCLHANRQALPKKQAEKMRGSLSAEGRASPGGEGGGGSVQE